MGTKSKRKDLAFDWVTGDYKRQASGAFGQKKLVEVEFTYVDLKTKEKSKRKWIIG